jgi:hypothetical protein
MVGQGSDPIIEMRYSRDAGQTWSNWYPGFLGKIGEYRARAIWRRLGLFDFPGAMFDFDCTDPVSLRISDVNVNDGGGAVADEAGAVSRRDERVSAADYRPAQVRGD